MNQQKSLAEQFAENRRWLEAEWKKLGLEETSLAAGDVTQSVKDPMPTNRVFGSNPGARQRS